GVYVYTPNTSKTPPTARTLSRKRKTTKSARRSNKRPPSQGANISPHGASRGNSPTSNRDGSGTEDEDDSVSLTLILKELRGAGKDVKEFRTDAKAQLLEIKGELDKVNTRLNEVETRVAEHEDKLQNTDEILLEILTIQEKLQTKLTSLEAYSRRESLRIYGVPEGVESGAPSMAHFVEKLLRENLAIPPSTSLQIQRAHRAISSLPPDGSQPRSILVKFLSFTVKEEVLRLAWQKRDFMLNSSKINLDNDFPSEIMVMRKEYAEARKVLKEKNLRFRTLYPTHLKVFFEEGVKTYNTVEEATADLASRGLPVKVITPPATPRERLQRCPLWWGVGGRRPRQNRGVAGYKEKLQVYRREEN
uniref:L1 transposable element RRM domain-containing protein n=1 Tax=Oreochromis aureus TaxID=47969 RepID=A0AAZ1Y238_OREAU